MKVELKVIIIKALNASEATLCYLRVGHLENSISETSANMFIKDFKMAHEITKPCTRRNLTNCFEIIYS